MTHRTQLKMFLCATFCLAAGTGIQDSIFNNYLRDMFALSAGARGGLEFPRELPGFLVVFMAGVLCMLPVTRLGLVGTLTFAAGMGGIVLAGKHFHAMVLMMMLSSAGMHLLQPTESSIAITLSDHGGRGRRMGQVGMIGTLGTITGALFVLLSFDKNAPPYALGFSCAAVMAALAGAVYFWMHIPHLHQPRARLVLRKKYWLYYLLETLFGARKQIFITFGVWVLIQVYEQSAARIAQLVLIAAVIGVFFKPMAGAAIDRFGERTILIADGLMLSVVCIGYGYAMHFAPTPEAALTVARACFIADSLLFSLGSGRAVYLSRVADSHKELTSTLAMGISINHFPSMTVPVIAGFAWEHFGYERVFLAAAVLAILNACVATLVPRKGVQAATLPATAD